MNFADFDKGFLIGGEHLLGSVPGSFTIDAMVDEFAVYSRNLSQAEIASHLVGVPVATQFVWKTDGLGSWTQGNWTPTNGVLANQPNSNQATAILGSAIMQPRTVVVSSAVTMKSLQIDNGSSYAVAGPGSLNLDANTGIATIDVVQGSHQIQAVINLHDNTTANVQAGAVLEINNRLNLQGHTLTKTGSGTLSINNIVKLDGGSLLGAGGSIGGSGTLLGDFDNASGTAAPGNSPGTFYISGNYTQGSAATLAIEIAAGQHDLLQVTGVASLAGTLDVRLLEGFQPALGDRFQILDAGSVVGAFDSIQSPSLESGLRWDFSGLYSSGSLSVAAAVPEPICAGMLACVGFGAIGLRRRMNAAAFRLWAVAFFVLCAAATAHADYPSAVMANGPVAYWRFEDGTAGTIMNNVPAADATGAHPGTYKQQGAADGPQLVTGAPGVGGTAAYFVGTSSSVGDYIQFTTLGNVGSNIDNNGLTFEFLLKNGGNSTTSNRIFGLTNDRATTAAADRNLTMSFGFQDLQAANGGPGDSIILRNESDEAWDYRTDLAGVNIEDGNWHHVAWVIDPLMPINGTHVYVDGVEITLSPATGVFAPKALTNNFVNFDKPFVLGAEHINNTPPGNAPLGLVRGFALNSILDEFAVFSAALSQAQITTHVQEITATSFDWRPASFGDWAAAASWAGTNGIIGGMPNNNKATAVFPASLVTPTTAVTEAVATVKGIQFQNATTVIAGNGSVQLQANTGSASLQVTQGSHQFQADVDLASATSADVANGAVLEFNNRFSLNGNTLTKTGAGKLLVNSNQNTGTGSVSVTGGVLGGGGRIGGTLTNSSGGTVGPGTSAGVLSVQGNYVQQSGSTLAIELGGLMEGEQYDVLNVTGGITLNGGTLNVTLVNGFSPALNNSFDILDFASMAGGGFTTLNLPGGAASWNTSQLLTTGMITFVGLGGDYNGDGKVNAADYVLWRKNPANFGGASGYSTWRASFGNPPGSGTSFAATVPEPALSALLVTLVFATALRGTARALRRNA